MTVTLADIKAARTVLEGNAVRTPMLHAPKLSDLTGAEIWVKLENMQVTNSFKDRGAFVRMSSLTEEERARGVIAMSAGNHAQAVAYHARRLGIPATIVMPETTPFTKLERTRAHGAHVVLHGEHLAESQVKAEEIIAGKGLVLIHPYDDEKVIAGQGTIALEMLATQPSLDAMVIAIGGGGLIAGMATAAKALAPAIEIIGVEADRFPSMYHALRGTTPAFGNSTIAEGIAVRDPGRITRDIVGQLVSDIVLVEEGHIEQAIVMLLDIEKTVVEGAGAASLAALLAAPERFRGRRVGLVLCGGNIDLLMLADIIERGMVRSGALARICVAVRDLPGALAKVAAVIAEQNANIEEVHHQRAFTHLAVQHAELEVVLKCRNHDHVSEVVAALGAAGFVARLANFHD